MAKVRKHREAKLEFGKATDTEFRKIAKAVLTVRSKPVKQKTGKKKRR